MVVRKLFILLLILTPFKVSAQTNMLKMYLHNGTINYFSLDEAVRVTPQGDSVFVSSNHVRMGYSKKNVWKYQFTNSTDLVGIQSTTLLPSDISVSRQGDDIKIDGLCQGTSLNVYNINGTQCSPSIDYSDGETLSATIHLGSLPVGIYIITAPKCPIFQSMKYVRY